jgi:hypothetical protein
MSRHEISEPQRRDGRMLSYGAGRGIVGCLAEAGEQPLRKRLRRADVHAARDVLLVGDVSTIWHATYWLSGYVKLLTAAASVATAVVLPFLVPKVLMLIQAVKLAEERRASTAE